jgi:hypothetical protein
MLPAMNRERGTTGGRWVKRLRTSAGKSRWAPLALAVACGAVALVAAPPSSATIDPGTELTPVVSSVTTKPTAVKGTDGRFHFAYELVVSNVTQLSLEITRLEVRDPHADRSLDVLEGDRLLENVTPLAGLPPGAAPSDVTKLDPSGTAIVWLDVTVKRRSALPSTLKHK